MRKLAAALAALGLGVALAQGAHAQVYSAEALRVIAQARQASGGDRAWNRVMGWRETGVRNGMRYETWADPLRYGHRNEIHEPAGLRVRGFNGAGDWQIAPDGAITGKDDRATLAEARTEAFVAARAYFFPSRFSAQGDLIGVRQADGRSFDVLKIEPGGGRPRELWFDRKTHLLARVIDRTGRRPVTTELSDYRRAGAIQAPFRFTIDDGDPAHRQVGEVRSISLTTADRALFSLPRQAPRPVRPSPAAEASPPIPVLASAPVATEPSAEIAQQPVPGETAVSDPPSPSGAPPPKPPGRRLLGLKLPRGFGR